MSYIPWYEQYKVSLPTGEVGKAKVERRIIEKEDAEIANLQMTMHGQGRRSIPPGEYTGLIVDGVLVMSDTPAEISDHMSFIHEAKGQVLLNGLGIGMCLQALLKKPSVEHVTVVEMEADVLALVAGHYLAMFGGEKITFVHADSLTWQPPKHIVYDAVWHDIWPVILGDYWPQYKLLHRKYARRSRYQDSWCRNWVRREALAR